jgi:hypothetical protein
MKSGPRINLDLKYSWEVRRDGADRCRVQGCNVLLAQDLNARCADGGRIAGHTYSCGNHDIDKQEAL